MKTFAIIFIFSFLQLTYSQSGALRTSSSEKLDLEELPEIVITKIGDDFSVYLPDRNPDLDVRQLQDHFIAYDLGKDYDGYNNYLVIMRNDKGTLTATYNQKGKLIRVVEKYENVKLPDKVIYSVLKTFPGWGIVDDQFHYTQADGDVLKKHYKVKIKKGKEQKRLLVAPNGEILKS
jgi:hypothetical protein